MLNFKKYFDFNWDKIKPLAISAVCFAAVFAAGYGVGKSAESDQETAKRSLHYNTKSPGQTNSAPTAAASDKTDCHIKGSKSKTYHMPGGAFYNKTNPAQCFNTEEEAQAAGYKKSSR